MKKLLVLGGARGLLPVIEAAHKLGCYVITCDYLPDNIAHKYSDEYHNISIIDKDAVLELAKELKVDGIMTYACDIAVTTVAYVAEKLGLPIVGPYESVEILQNKGKFRKFLKENGFNVPNAKAYSKIEEALKDVDLFNWPVIVKPTDSSGSRGVIRVDKKEELRNAIEYALKYSIGKEFIIEDFLIRKGYASECECFSMDGKLRFFPFSDQRFDDKAENPNAPVADVWPDSMSLEHKEELISEIQRLLDLLKMKTTIYNIETRVCVNNKAYIMECSPRGGGGGLAEILKYATGVDLISNTVRAALGLPINNLEQRNFNGYWILYSLHSNTEGIFDELDISEEIKNNIVKTEMFIKKGDLVEKYTGEDKAVASMFIRFDTQEKLNDFYNKQNELIKIKLKK